MATWKRLTGIGTNETVDVNLDHVAFMKWDVNQTIIYFVGSAGSGPLTFLVRETPDEIHGAEEYRSKAAGAI